MAKKKIASRMPHTICIASGKGGVGKTTATAALAYLFAAKKKKKVLLLDADAQINLTQVAGAKLDGRRDILGAVVTRLAEDEEAIPIENFILPTQYQNIDIIPGNPYIEKDDFLSKVRQSKLEYNMNPWIEVMEAVKGLARYDFILMDTHPSTGMATTYPLQGCDFVLVPLEPSSSSISGFREIYKEILKARRTNPRIRLLGTFFNRVKLATNTAKEYVPSARETIVTSVLRMNKGKGEGVCFKALIRDSDDVQKAMNLRRALTEYLPKSKVAADFKELFEEIGEELAK